MKSLTHEIILLSILCLGQFCFFKDKEHVHVKFITRSRYLVIMYMEGMTVYLTDIFGPNSLG